MELKNFSDDQLIQELQDRGYIRVLWHKDDILKVAEENEVTLTDDEVYDIITDLEQNHDANYGLSWDTINDVLTNVINNRKK
jgi:hypothetical protein